jgi:hypothetical protein
MLSHGDRIILEFESRWWLEPGPKDQAIEFTLGLSADLYYERLLDIVSGAEAVLADPITVHRVRAMIEPGPSAEAAVS